MKNPVRVYIEESKTEVTVGAGYAEACGLTVLDKEAVDQYGAPLPPKPHVALGEQPPNPRRSQAGKANQAANTEANEEAN